MLVREHTGRVAVGVLSLALPVLMLWRCTAHPEPPRTTADAATSPDTPPPASPASLAPPAPPASVAPPASGTASPAASAGVLPSSSSPLTSLTAPTPSAPPNAAAPIIAAVSNRDPRDLALLSRIERELKRDPPPAVHALIRLRASGAPRSQLLSELDRQIPQDVALKVLVRRWIDEVTSGSTLAPKSLGPAPSGTHDRLVKPIERAP